MKKVYNVDIEDQIFPMATTDADCTVGKFSNFSDMKNILPQMGFEPETFCVFPKKDSFKIFFRQLQLNPNAPQLADLSYCVLYALT